MTHVVTEFESLDQVENQAAKDGLQLPRDVCVVSMKWLVECLKSSTIVSVQDSHVLKKVTALFSLPAVLLPSRSYVYSLALFLTDSFNMSSNTLSHSTFTRSHFHNV